MAITASALRANIYRLLDEVLDTGRPLEVRRGARTLVIAARDPAPRLERLVTRDDYIVGDPDALVHLDWSHEWRP